MMAFVPLRASRALGTVLPQKLDFRCDLRLSSPFANTRNASRCPRSQPRAPRQARPARAELQASRAAAGPARPLST